MAIDEKKLAQDYGLDEAELKKVEEMIRTNSFQGNINSKGNSFINLCRNNIIIPILMVIAITSLAIGIIYFSTKEDITPVNSLGFNYETLVTNYKNTETYNTLFKDFNTELPEIEFTDDGDKNNQVKYFGTSIQSDFTSYAIAIQGSARKSDSEITALRFMFEMPEDNEEKEEMSSALFIYFEMIMNSVFPELDTNTIDSMLASTSKTQQFETYGNIAYRFSIQKVDDISFYALDFAPAADYENFDK